jgi:uncharacterized alkaline shock family protein YloU
MSERGTRSGGGTEGGGGTPQGERGSTTISDAVVVKLAGIAAQEVDGIRMGGASQAAGSLLGSITGGGGQTRGVSVEVGQEEAAVDLTCTAEYGRSIPQVSEAVRRNVVNRVESLTGLRVTEVNVTVADVYLLQEEVERRGELEEGRQERSRAGS